MQTWALSPYPSQPSANVSPLYVDECLAGAIETIGEREFPVQALRCVNAVVSVDFWSVYRLYPNRPPRMYLSGSLGGRDVSMDCFRRYQRGLYREDKTFAEARVLTSAGKPAMTLWNEAEIPSPHRDQIYRRHGIHERLSVVTTGGAEGLLAINLYRYDTTGSYRDREVDAAQSFARPVLACVNKHLQMLGCLRKAATISAMTARELLLDRNPNLTPRELDVCERLLRGWTYDGIARDLGLSATSVKTYRARAFDRLGIHFRNELVALTMRGGFMA